MSYKNKCRVPLKNIVNDNKDSINTIETNANDVNFKITISVRRSTDTDPEDSGVDLNNGNALDGDSPAEDDDALDNEVMLDPWSSMESSASPSTESGPSVTTNEGASPKTDYPSPARLIRKTDSSDTTRNTKNDAKMHALSLNLERLELLDDEVDDPKMEETGRRKPHFLDEDYRPPPRNGDACKIPKPHFLDQSPSPDNPNFLDDEANVDAPPPPRRENESAGSRETFRTHLHRGLERNALAERDERTSQLYRGTWPGERDLWPGGQDSVSVKSFSSAGSANAPHGGGIQRQSQLGTKVDCVYSLLSLLSLSPDNNADMSDTLLEMSQTVESCVAMRQSGCIPLLVQLVHSKLVRTTKDKAAQALYNIIHAQPVDKSGRREARVWRLLEQVREYCYALEDLATLRKESADPTQVKDDMTKHPGQSVATLMKLSFDEEHRHAMCQLGGLQALATLVSLDQETHGSLAEDTQCVTMRKYAGMALTNLTFGDGNNKALLCSFKDFMLALVDQLESPNDDMRQVTAAVLRNLSWRADSSSKQILREVSAVKGLTMAAMTCQKEATLKSILSALWNLTAHCSLNKVDLCSVEGALGFLVDMLSFDAPSKTLAIIENSGGILRNVSSHIAVHEDYRQTLRERNCLGVLLQQLKSPSLTVVSNSCGTLWNLSARCPQDQQYLWNHGAVPMLRSLIHSKHKMIAMGSSAALKNLLNSKPGKSHIISLDTTARNMNLPVLPTLGARKQKALEQDIDQTLSETCDNIEPATSPTTNHRDEKILYSAAERQLSMNLDRHNIQPISFLQTAVKKGGHISRSTVVNRNDRVNRSESRDSVTSTHSDTVYERVARNVQIIPTKKTAKSSKPTISKSDRDFIKRYSKEGGFIRSPVTRNNYVESGYEIDQEGCDQPIDYSQKYSETKIDNPPIAVVTDDATDQKSDHKPKPATFGDYQETDLDQPTDYSLRYAEDPSENGSVISEPPGPSVHEDTIKYFCTEGTPYETPINFSTATSMSDLRMIGAGNIPQGTAPEPKKPNVKINSEIMTQSDEKDTCSIEDNSRHDNDAIANAKEPPVSNVSQVPYESKFSSGMITPEKPVNYCEEGTPGYFSRVSSLSSLEEGNETGDDAKDNIDVNNGQYTPPISSGNIGRDKEGSKAVTFASDPITLEVQQTTNETASSAQLPNYAEETPLMFSRCSSLGSLSGCSVPDQGSVVSEFSRMTSGCISPSELPDSPGQSIPHSPIPRTMLPLMPPPSHPTNKQANNAATDFSKKEAFTSETAHVRLHSVFEDAVSTFQVEHTPIEFSTATSLSSLTIDDEPTTKAPITNATVSKEPICQTKPLTQIKDADSATTDGSSCTSDDGKSGHGGSDKEDDILAACISAGMQSKIKTRIPTPTSPLKRPTGPISTSSPKVSSKTKPRDFAELQPLPDTCHTYFTEDTPAILSKAGSQSNLSVLSIETDTGGDLPAFSSAGKLASDSEQKLDNGNSSDESSNLSADSGNLLAECIRSGMPKGMQDYDLGERFKTNRKTIAVAEDHHRNDNYRSGNFDKHIGSIYSGNFGEQSPPPPLPPKAVLGIPPPPPPHSHQAVFDHIKSNRLDDGDDSLSSLSVDSLGSTDGELLFRQCVRSGLPRSEREDGNLERTDRTKPKRNDTRTPRDPEFERLVAAGAFGARTIDRMTATEEDLRARALLEEAIYSGMPKRKSAMESEVRLCADGCSGSAATKNVAAPSAGAEAIATALAGGETALTNAPQHSAEPPSDADRVDAPDPPNALRDGSDSGSNASFEDSAFDHSNEFTARDCDVFNYSVGSESKRTDSNRSNESYANLSACDADDFNRETFNSESCSALPDLLEESIIHDVRENPDLTERLCFPSVHLYDDKTPTNEMKQLFTDHKIIVTGPESLSTNGTGSSTTASTVIDAETIQFPNCLTLSVASMTSMASLDLDHVKPPSRMGSLLSLTQSVTSGQWNDIREKSPQLLRKTINKTRKKSLPVALMVKRALGNSTSNYGSSEHLDYPSSLLDNIKPPSELDFVYDMENSMASVASITSEQNVPLLFDIKPPLYSLTIPGDIADLDTIGPPSLFEEMNDCTLISGDNTYPQSISDTGSPLPTSDYQNSSAESTPKKTRTLTRKRLTPKQKRQLTQDRFMTYTIADTTLTPDSQISNISDTGSESKSAVTRISPKQRRIQDRSRYQTQTVNVSEVIFNGQDTEQKKTQKQKRIENADRFRTQTIVATPNTERLEDSNSECDQNSGTESTEQNPYSDADQEIIQPRKPKIVKPNLHRDVSLDSNGSIGTDDRPKGIRGRQKAPYVSPYRRNIVTKKSPARLNGTVKPSEKPKISKPVQKVPPLQRQGTFTMEESTILPKSRVLPVAPEKSAINTSPSRLPQPKSGIKNRMPPIMKNSPSNQSLQSNDSSKTVTLKPTTSRCTNSTGAKPPKEITSRIASLWKKVEQKKAEKPKNDNRIWITNGDDREASSSSKLIRSSTFEGPPNTEKHIKTPAKQKSSIAIRTSQIPNSRYSIKATTPDKTTTPRKPIANRSFLRKPMNREVFT